MSGTWTLACKSCSLLQVLSDKERKKILELIECQINSRASVLFLAWMICFVMSVLYWTFSTGSNSSPFDLNWNNSLTSSSSVITSQHFFCFSAIKSSLWPLIYSYPQRWHDKDYLMIFEVWLLKRIKKVELTERGYLLSFRSSLLKEDFKILYVLIRLVFIK